MADHVNISDPTCSRSERQWEHMLAVALLKAEMDIIRKERDHWKDNLDAVFTRLRRGDEIWITDDDGQRLTISANRPHEEPKT